MPDRPLTILQLTHEGHGAGSTMMIASLSRQLAGRGHRVLVGCRAGSVLARMVADAGLQHVPLDFGRLAPLARDLDALMTRERVDLVNSHGTGDRRALTWLRWRRRLGRPFVVTRHTMPLTSPAELVAVGLSADRTIAVSHAVARALRRRLYPAGRLGVVPNGIELARVDAAPSEEDMAAARAALGDLARRPVILVLARRKDQYVPFTDRPLAFCRLAAVSALPSRIEGLSIALLETMALGLPVVASDAGGNPDLITSGETGVLVPPLDPAAWAQALARVLGDREFAGRIARQGRELVRKEFTLERTAERTEAEYREALERRRSLDGNRSHTR